MVAQGVRWRWLQVNLEEEECPPPDVPLLLSGRSPNALSLLSSGETSPFPPLLQQQVSHVGLLLLHVSFCGLPLSLWWLELLRSPGEDI